MKNYLALKRGFILGRYRNEGDLIENVSDYDAKYLVMEGCIAEKAENKASSMKVAGSKRKVNTSKG